MFNMSRFSLVLLFILAPLDSSGADIKIPPSQGFVSDFAQVINPEYRQRLTFLLQELKDKTGAEIVVVTVETTQSLTAFDYAIKIAEAWKPGAKGKDNGVVFLVVTKDRKLFIATGYGVEGVLPDGKVGEIRDEFVVPYFKKGDYARGILAGTQVMASLIAKAQGQVLTGLAEEIVQRWTAFSREHGVQRFLTLDALSLNPFVYEDETVAARANFQEMTSEDTGLFSDGSNLVLVSGIPRDIRARFTARYYVILAGRVLGKTEVRVPLLGAMSAPYLKFVGVHFCGDQQCSDLIIENSATAVPGVDH